MNTESQAVLPTFTRVPSPLPSMPPDTAYARNSRAFLGSLDDMPSASDFLAASDLGGFEEEVELEVPPQDKYPELEGHDSPRALEHKNADTGTSKNREEGTET